MDDALQTMWNAHRNYLRRLLIGLTRDIDLADDLLQETLLRANNGFAGYRGGDGRAWLTTIGRNLYFEHRRRRYVTDEVPMCPDEDLADTPVDYDLQMDINRAVADLDPVSRTALLMKHYGGFTYREIAKRLECPVGTAKWRISAALDRLRVALGVVEVATMKCSELDGARLLDYVDGLLSGNQLAQVKAHLAECPHCRNRIGEIADIARMLDTVEGDWRCASIFELYENGGFTNYGWFSMPNTSDEPTEVFEFGHSGVTYITIQGEEVHPEPVAGEDGKYRARLSHPIPPGQRIHLHHAAEHQEDGGASVKLENGNWRFGPGRLHLTDPLLYVFAVRLPQGAVVIKPEPKPQEIRTKGVTTVIWRDTLPPDQPIEFWVEYSL